VFILLIIHERETKKIERCDFSFAQVNGEWNELSCCLFLAVVMLSHEQYELSYSSFHLWTNCEHKNCILCNCIVCSYHERLVIMRGFLIRHLRLSYDATTDFSSLRLSLLLTCCTYCSYRSLKHRKQITPNVDNSIHSLDRYNFNI